MDNAVKRKYLEEYLAEVRKKIIEQEISSRVKDAKDLSDMEKVIETIIKESK